MKIKIEVNKSKSKNNLFMAGNCHSKQKKVKLICSWSELPFKNKEMRLLVGVRRSHLFTISYPDSSVSLIIWRPFAKNGGSSVGKVSSPNEAETSAEKDKSQYRIGCWRNTSTWGTYSTATFRSLW